MPQETWQRTPSAIHRGWRYTIAFHRDLDEEPEAGTPEFRALLDAVVAALKAARDYAATTPCGQELRELTEEMDDAQNLDEFNFTLQELYDWGDQYRVIINLGE